MLGSTTILRMKIYHLVLVLIGIPTILMAETKPSKDSVSVQFGQEKRSSAFFKDQYLHNNLVHYLDNYSDFITYQAETTGDFQMPDLLLFSISGNSYRWNKYDVNGFRTDNRFFPGSSYFNPDLYTNSLIIDSYDTQLSFTSDEHIKNSFGVRYNKGGLGGISPLSEELVNLYHPTASQRVYQPIEYRRQMKHSGSIFLNYNLKAQGHTLPQQIQIDAGTRMLVGFNYEGIDSYYPEDFLKVQLNGQLPFKLGGLFDASHYIVNVANRQNLFTELNFARNESASYRNIQGSLYGTKRKKNIRYTSGITASLQSIQHNDLNFSRNLMDQDGEAFEPWYPDGNVLELTHAFNLKKELNEDLSLEVDAFNSLIDFQPTEEHFNQTSYAENVNLPYQSLYLYDWSSQQFMSGLLENRVRINYKRELNSNWSFQGFADATLDGMLITEKSMIRPNWQLQLNFKYQPSDRFLLEVNVGRRRVAFNYDHIRFFSNDYLNGQLYFWSDANNDRTFQENEKGDFFTTTGGNHHKAASQLKQATYFVLDVPMEYRSGHHTYSMVNTYKKYNHQWTTQFDKGAAAYGNTTSVNGQSIFYLNSGEANYEVQEYPDEYFSESTFLRFAVNSPYYFSNTLKYKYATRKAEFSFSWTSYIMAGVSTLGNGPLHNNIDVLSETSANPNSLYKLLGRLDQERALVARIFFSYAISDNWKLALTGKFKDGQPFTNFRSKLIENEAGNTQLAIWSRRTKGINPFTHEFGSRDDAFFNTEIRVSYSNSWGQMPFDIQLMIYNIYDFGTELVEYSFQPDETSTRYAMEINIPRGLMLTAHFYFN